MATIQVLGAPAAELVAAALDALPEGHSFSQFEGGRWSVVSTRRAGGANRAVEARRLDQVEQVSGNVYHLDRGLAVRPCEVSTRRFLAFLVEQRPIPPRVEPGEPLVHLYGPIGWIRHAWSAHRLRRRARRVLRP